MTVSSFVQPNFTTQTATQYKTNIDNSIAVLAEVAGQFAPREAATPAMSVVISDGMLMDGSVISAATVSGIGAPSTNNRIDRIYLDLADKTFKRKNGVEAASPVPPVLDIGVYPICQILVRPGAMSLRNSDIIDERTAVTAPIAILKDGYTTLVDPNGLTRILIGKPGFDNRIVVRLHSDDSGSLFELQNSSGVTVATIDATGNLKVKGTITANATF